MCARKRSVLREREISVCEGVICVWLRRCVCVYDAVLQLHESANLDPYLSYNS